MIGPEVEIGEGVRIGPHVFIERDTRVGEDVRISKGAVLGTDPQDLKYGGERTFLEIGPRTRIREFATINRGTAASGITKVGADALIMSYAHIAHDCRIGDHVVLANSVNMGGHVEIGDWAIVGGLTPIHQFVRIGRNAMVGGMAGVNQDVLPFSIVEGTPARLLSVNAVGLKRANFKPNVRTAIKKAFKIIARTDLNTTQAIEKISSEVEMCDEINYLLNFIKKSTRGITK